MPAGDRRQVDHVAAAAGRRLGLAEHAQVARVDLAALPHPLRRGPLVGDAHLIGRVGEQPPHDCGADRAGPAGDQHATHAQPVRLIHNPRESQAIPATHTPLCRARLYRAYWRAKPATKRGL